MSDHNIGIYWKESWHARITSSSSLLRTRSIALSTSSIVPETITTLSDVPGKNSKLRDNWIRAPDCDWKSFMVEPPLPITDPASAFDKRNLMWVDFSSWSEKRKDVKC